MRVPTFFVIKPLFYNSCKILIVLDVNFKAIVDNSTWAMPGLQYILSNNTNCSDVMPKFKSLKNFEAYVLNNNNALSAWYKDVSE